MAAVSMEGAVTLPRPVASERRDDRVARRVRRAQQRAVDDQRQARGEVERAGDEGFPLAQHDREARLLLFRERLLV